MTESKNFRISTDDEGYVNIELKRAFVESMWINPTQIDELIDTLTKFKEEM